ncbi:MAG TPA: polysaccharide biosynthesis protein, partial [Holophaga sp.]|nr:polysaccharide biosynthesis protein [Holophaga sp.]
MAWQLSVLLNGVDGKSPALAALWGLFGIGISTVLRLPRRSYRAIGFRDLLTLLYGGILCLATGATLDIILHATMPGPDVWVLASFLTMFLWAAVRGLVRSMAESEGVKAADPKAKRTLVVGAGRAGVMVAEELKHHPELGYHLVGFVDDDLSKQSLWIHDIPVLGPQELLPLLIKQEIIDQVILAIPSASGRDVRALTARLQPLGIPLKTVPGVYTLLGTPDWRPVLRDVSIEDLLRREPVTLDQARLQGALTDQVVLVTGAGGSIGSELCRQICRFNPSRLVLLGRGEHSLWLIERELRRTFPNQALAVELCDIRNRWRLEQVFGRWRPAVVIHAAAHKHVPFLEIHPEEAVDNNVFGTRNVVETAMFHRTAFFVNISTDKAVNPTNVLGVSKRIAEYLVLDAAAKVPANARYVTVRFGNVLGSRGSVIPIFQDQIRRGGPITLTHPDMTRYF